MIKSWQILRVLNLTPQILFSLAVLSPCAFANVKMPAIFSDHMVLQQDATVPVWGWAAAGEKVAVSIGGQKQTTTADQEGRWKVTLAKMLPGTPQTLTVTGNNTIVINDVLVGEVWICSGQSNMEFPLKRTRNANTEIAAANYPGIRSFTVVKSPLASPVEDIKAKWVVCSPSEAADFTAVGYFFGRELHENLKFPVGLIHASVGGTPAEAWTSAEGLAQDPGLKTLRDKQIIALEHLPENTKRFASQIADWEVNYGGDTNNKGEDQGWADPEFDDSAWQNAALPATFAKLGIKTGGSVWFRGDVHMGSSTANKAFSFMTGNGTEKKVAYFNGKKVPAVLSKPAFFVQNIRFNVPAELVREGKNTIAIRVYSHTDNGGISTPPVNWGVPAGTAPREWRCNVETPGPELTPEARAALPVALDANASQTATYLFNGMIRPLIPYAIRGAIWYQGESNYENAYQYRRLLPSLIADWRGRWGEGNFPFYIVQIANFQAALSEPGPSRLAELREAQSLAAANVPNTGIAVTIDIGAAGDIHPTNKQDVGHRLALAALAKTYGRKLNASGPVYESKIVEGGAIRLKFFHAEGLVAKGGPLKQFAIAGEDQKFVWADASIDGDSVLVSSPRVSNPVAVRYAWAGNPEGCNLSNSSGLPASPFRTDDWPGLSANSY